MPDDLETLLKTLDLRESQKCAIRGFVDYKSVMDISYGGERPLEQAMQHVPAGYGHMLTGKMNGRDVTIFAPSQRGRTANVDMGDFVSIYTKRPDGSYENFYSGAAVRDQHRTFLDKDPSHSGLQDNPNGVAEDIAPYAPGANGPPSQEHKDLHEATKCKVGPVAEGKKLKPLQPLA